METTIKQNKVITQLTRNSNSVKVPKRTMMLLSKFKTTISKREYIAVRKITTANMHTLRALVSKQFYKETATRTYITSRTYTHLEKRSFATIRDWQVKQRVATPLKPGEQQLDYTLDRVTGYKIMQPKDKSGYNHLLAIDGTFQSDDYCLVVGCFTSTKKPVDGIIPTYVGDTLLNGVKKPQYFIHYPEPMLLFKESLKAANIEIVNIDHKKFLASLPVPPKDIY